MNSLVSLPGDLADSLGQDCPGMDFCAGMPGRPLCAALKRPLCVLRLAKLTAGDAALGDLLLSADGEGRAVYGKKAAVTLRLALYSGKDGGEGGVEKAFSTLADALLFSGEPRLCELSRGEAVYQLREEVWQVEALARFELLLLREEERRILEVELRTEIG